MTFQTPYSPDFSVRKESAISDVEFYQRWSPRSFQKVAIDQETQAKIFDAARWSPSCFNEQPWLIVTSTDETFSVFLGLLTEGNQPWAKRGSLLGFIFARRCFTHNDKPNVLARFDCGAAWLGLTLQARRLGLYTHGMGGIHREKTYDALSVSQADYEVMCGFALGAIAKPEALGDEERAKAELRLSGRLPLDSIWRSGLR